MKIKRGYIIFVILISLIAVISGCTQLQNLPTPNLPSLPGIGTKEKQITESKGLTIKFLENQPPLDEIFTGKNFKIAIELTNNDPSDISGTISISDTPSDDFSTLQGKEQQSFSLEPAEVIDNKVIPSKDTVIFGPYQYDDSKIFKGMTTNFITEISTTHKPIITTQLCIKSSSAQESRCSNKETITRLSGQAKYSPVTVTKIEKTVIPEEEGLVNLNLKIYIKNTGKGKIDNTDETIEYINIDLQGSNLDCSKTRLSLKEGESIIVCTADLALSDELFRQEILDISFEYQYKIIETLGPIKVTSVNYLNED